MKNEVEFNLFASRGIHHASGVHPFCIVEASARYVQGMCKVCARYLLGTYWASVGHLACINSKTSEEHPPSVHQASPIFTVQQCLHLK